MANEKRLIDAAPLAKNGWHLVKTGESNRFLAQMSLADVPTVDAVEVVHAKWEKSDIPHEKFCCSACGGACWYYDYEGDVARSRYCPNCGAKMDGGN